MSSFVKGKSIDIYGFITYLASAEIVTHIHSLKQRATKKKPFSFERLSLVFLPIFKFFEVKRIGNEGELAKIRNAISEWMQIINSHSGINVNTKFEA